MVIENSEQGKEITEAERIENEKIKEAARIKKDKEDRERKREEARKEEVRFETEMKEEEARKIKEKEEKDRKAENALKKESDERKAKDELKKKEKEERKRQDEEVRRKEEEESKEKEERRRKDKEERRRQDEEADKREQENDDKLQKMFGKISGSNSIQTLSKNDTVQSNGLESNLIIQIEVLTKDLVKANENIVIANKTTNRLRTERDKLKVNEKILEETKISIDKTNSELSHNIRKLEDELKVLMNKNKDDKKIIEDLSASLKESKNEALLIGEELKTNLLESDKKKEMFKFQQNLYESKIENLENSIQIKDSLIESMKSERTELEDQLEESKELEEKLKEENKKLKRSLKDNEDEIEEELDYAREKFKKLQNRIQFKNNFLTNVLSTMFEMKSKLEVLQAEKDERENQDERNSKINSSYPSTPVSPPHSFASEPRVTNREFGDVKPIEFELIQDDQEELDKTKINMSDADDSLNVKNEENNVTINKEEVDSKSFTHFQDIVRPKSPDVYESIPENGNKSISGNSSIPTPSFVKKIMPPSKLRHTSGPVSLNNKKNVVNGENKLTNSASGLGH